MSSPVSTRGASRGGDQVLAGVPAHVLTAALYERYSSPGEAGLADRVLRKAFRGHVEKPGPA